MDQPSTVPPEQGPASKRLAKEIQAVAEKLERPRTSGPERLELLRRQAALGDLRDARDLRRRRAVD